MTELEKQILNNQLIIMEALKCLLEPEYKNTYNFLDIQISKTNFLLNETN